jgi:hypothetical protein
MALEHRIDWKKLQAEYQLSSTQIKTFKQQRWRARVKLRKNKRRWRVCVDDGEPEKNGDNKRKKSCRIQMTKEERLTAEVLGKMRELEQRKLVSRDEENSD